MIGFVKHSTHCDEAVLDRSLAVPAQTGSAQS